MEEAEEVANHLVVGAEAAVEVEAVAEAVTEEVQEVVAVEVAVAQVAVVEGAASADLGQYRRNICSDFTHT